MRPDLKNWCPNMSETDVLEKLTEEGIDILSCMQCGICSGSCPSGRHISLNVRRLVRKACKNMDMLSDDELWMCTTCYTCQERCPRGISITDAILKIRTIAVHEGNILPEHGKVSQLLMEYGHAVPINEENMKLREEMGLQPLPETVHSDPDALEEVKKLIESCGFDKLIPETEQEA